MKQDRNKNANKNTNKHANKNANRHANKNTNYRTKHEPETNYKEKNKNGIGQNLHQEPKL